MTKVYVLLEQFKNSILTDTDVVGVYYYKDDALIALKKRKKETVDNVNMHYEREYWANDGSMYYGCDSSGDNYTRIEILVKGIE